MTCDVGDDDARRETTDDVDDNNDSHDDDRTMEGNCRRSGPTPSTTSSRHQWRKESNNIMGTVVLSSVVLSGNIIR